MRFSYRMCALVALCSCAAFSQQRVDSSNLYERVLAVVPMTGSGTWEDPKRPLFAPARRGGKDGSGVIAWQFQPSDDGQSAIVELVFADRAAAATTVAALKSNGSVKAFRKGQDKPEDIEKAVKAVRKDFQIDKFAVRVP